MSWSSKEFQWREKMGNGGERMDTGETITTSMEKVYQSTIKAHKKRDKLEYKVILKGEHGFKKDQQIIIMDLKEYKALSLEATGETGELQKCRNELQSIGQEKKNLTTKIKKLENDLKSLGDNHQTAIKELESDKLLNDAKVEQLNKDLKAKDAQYKKLKTKYDGFKADRLTTILYLGRILEYIDNQDKEQKGFFPWIKNKLVGEPRKVPTPPEALLIMVNRKGLGGSKGDKDDKE